VIGLVAVGWIVEPRLPPPFRQGEQWRDRERHQQPTTDAVADGGLDQQDEEELVDRRPNLVLIDENEGSDDDRVDREPEHADPAGRASEFVRSTQQEEADSRDRQ
jgi:hypothetical protein